MQITAKQKKTLIIIALAALWFYIIPLVYQYLFVNTDNPKKVIQQVENHLNKQEQSFSSVLQNKNLLSSLYNGDYSEQDLLAMQKLQFGIQIYEVFNDSTINLKFWNNNIVLPSYIELWQPDGKYISKKDCGTFELVKKTIKVSNRTIFITALLPIYWSYFVETDYLKNTFAANKNFIKKYEATQEPTIYPVKNNEGKIILYIKKVTNNRNVGYSWVYVLCRTLTVLLLLLFIVLYAKYLQRIKNFKIAFYFLFTFITLFAVVFIYTNVLFDHKVFEFFDPRIFAVNSLFHSLGDTSCILLCSGILVFYWILFYDNSFHIAHKVMGLPAMFWIKMLLLVVSTFVCIWLCRSLILSSKISFNVTNFFSLNVYSLMGFLHIAGIVFVYFLFTQKIVKIESFQKIPNFILFVVIAIIGIVVLFFNFFWANDVMAIFFLIWLLLYVAIAKYLQLPQSRYQFSLHIIWMLFFSFFAAILLQYENNKKELIERKSFAQKLAFQSDPNTENLLSIALTKFDQNFLYNNINNLYQQNDGFRNKLLQDNFVGYLNKFQTKMYVYDSLEKPLYNTDAESYAYFNTMLQNQGVKINTLNDLYYVEIGFDEFTYIYKKTISDTAGKILGYFIVQSNPLSYKNNSTALSPELFKQRNSKLDDNGNNYIYAIYNNYELRKRFFDYDLPTRITPKNIPIKEDTLQYRNGYEELWLKLNKNSIVVVGKKQNITLTFVTLFAYIFFSIILLVAIVALIEFIILRQRKLVQYKKLFQLNFSRQVQFMVWLVSLITFIVVAYVIIQQFKSRFQKTNNERLNRTMRILIADVQNKLNTQSVFDDVVKIYEPGSNNALKDMIFQMSEIHNVDFNIYDLSGNLKLSSQPFMESKGVVSNKINAMALFYLQKKSSAQYVQQESIGSFKYLSMYVPIRDDEGNAYGYLNIPYYSSSSDLNQEISNFLVTIINITAFIFLIAGLIAWWVTSNITNSFDLIGKKMRDISLGNNETIQWDKDDELGQLVKEYNKMVKKLDQSVAILAKTERESAWREMARQVAHEIKNPLTPMKLSIQYLQKNIASGGGNIEELTNRVTATLVEQIDHLSNIASDFSQFANINNSKLENVNMLQIIESVQQLFNAEVDVDIQINSKATSVIVLADKTQMNRWVTNLIKNAIQAYSNTEIKKVNITIDNQFNEIVIAIKDYANGIPVALQAKIFTPNFTTKSSGTGLGLAISKGIIENANGTIYFETMQNIGTTFFIQLPIVNS